MFVDHIVLGLPVMPLKINNVLNLLCSTIKGFNAKYFGGKMLTSVIPVIRTARVDPEAVKP